MNSSDWVARYFTRCGVKKIFLYPGGTIAPLVNACLGYGISTEVFKNEQGAVYAALAYARVTGKVQVAMVTSGPGVTNAITPLADAFYDSTPLILITGQIGTSDLKIRKAVRQRGFQEVPTVALTSSIAKRSTCMLSLSDVFREIPSAFEVAESGRPGPVVIDFPMDIQRSEFTGGPDVSDIAPTCSLYKTSSLDTSMVSAIAAVSAAAKRPVLFLGHGALTAGKFSSYIQIADAIDARVVTSLLGIGSYDSSDPRWLGYVGHTGHLAANRAVYECDFLLVLGARLDVRQTGTLVERFVPNGRVAWVNSDVDELDNPRVEVEWKINADVGAFCDALLKQLDPRTQETDQGWMRTLNGLQAEKLEDRPQDQADTVQPREVLHALTNRMNGCLVSTVVTGVGCH